MGPLKKLKAMLPPEEAVRASERLFAALGNRTRLLILHCLSKSEELCVCELAALLDTKLPALSHQLRHLRQLGLVDFRTEGRWAIYRLTSPEAADLVASQLDRPTSGATRR